jgi:hypothetical protein
MALQLTLALIPNDAWWLQLFVSYESRGSIPFVSDTLSGVLLVVAGATALALGLAQTFLESTRGTYAFLLHRPVRRDRVWLHKLAVGVVLTLAVSALPVFVYAVWAAVPGTHASPFSWSMTAWAWQLVAATPLLYLGAFLSGLRPGRLLGSRLFPAAGAFLLFTLAQAPVGPEWLRLALVLLSEALLAAMIVYVGDTRDYS